MSESRYRTALETLIESVSPLIPTLSSKQETVRALPSEWATAAHALTEARAALQSGGEAEALSSNPPPALPSDEEVER